ncbi:MAG: high-affinity iron transporter [Nocardioidaceae bacterium]|nr:high-affinity iron transporter [Nocardioidaceae bacterium]
MLPTFVIGLREGLEASLIVGIIAAFLRRNASSSGLRRMWLGVLAAVALCVAAGVGLELLSSELPQRQQEGLETVVAVAAVGMVTYMIVWMKRHSRDLKGSLESAAGSAVAQHSALALVAMAFLAVLREGLETVVFLLAAFDASGAAGAAALGAALGILVAVGLGYAVYRGGVRLNLSRFFRATGVVLALVAAGLVVSALHTAHEAGWVDVGQDRTFSLHWLAAPGSIRASLLTGVLGVQPDPVLIEVVAWLAYAVPVVAIVCWPPGRELRRQSLSRAFVAAAAALLATAGALAVMAPARPAAGAGESRAVHLQRSLTPGPAAEAVQATSASRATPADDTVDVRSVTPSRLVVRWGAAAGDPVVTLRSRGEERLGGVVTRLYSGSSSARGGASRSGWARTLTPAQVSRAMDGRLPLGLAAASSAPMTVVHTSFTDYRVYVDPAGESIVDARSQRRTVAAVTAPAGDAVSLGLVAQDAAVVPQAAVSAAVADIRHNAQLAERHEWMRVRWPLTLTVVGLGLLVLAWSLRTRRDLRTVQVRRLGEGAT